MQIFKAFQYQKIMEKKSRRVWYEQYQKYIVGVGDKFSKPFKTYLGKDAVYNFINNKIKESKYYMDVMKKHFNKKLVMTKKDNEVFKNSTRYWICDNDYVHNDVKVRNHCHITKKYRDAAHRDCNINVKLNQKIPVKFHSPNFKFHLIIHSIIKY